MESELDAAWLVDLAKKAGDLAYGYFGRATAKLKPDDSWVTEADLAVERFVREALAAARPDDAVIGEEGDTTVSSSSRFVWAIDPIDGTRAFYHGFPVWGVSIGLLLDDQPHAGAVILPVVGDLYHSDGRDAFLNGVRLASPSAAIDKNAVFLISEGAYQARTVDYPGKVLSLGSAAAHLCYVAGGSAIGAMDRAAIWDYAAGAAILSTLGIPPRYASGNAIDFSVLYDGRTVAEPTLFASDLTFRSLQAAAVQP